MSENKTQPTEISVEDFIRNSDPRKIDDSFKLVEMMEKLSGEKATMWGPSIIGFGSYHYKYATGREGDMCKIGFSPRKDKFSLYLMNCGSNKHEELISRLGKLKKGSSSCIHFAKLSDLNLDVLAEMIKNSLEHIKKMYG